METVNSTAYEQVQKNLCAFHERVASVCASCGRRESEIQVVAATKCVPIDIIEQLPAWGMHTVGENRVQEFNEKYSKDIPLQWHIIGALQTNKVKYVIGKVQMIQSVDRLSLAEEIQRLSAKQGIVTDVLIEVNIGAEENKSGVAPEKVDELAAVIAQFDCMRLRGIMSVPPIGAETVLYERMRKLYETLHGKYNSVDTLSMGMSNDFETAIRCGTTMIRPGRVLFGARV